MVQERILARMRTGVREIIREAVSGDEDLGPLMLLPGIWKSDGRGWNMIALPFADGDQSYRLLMNQYDEELTFSVVDKGVPNRGVHKSGTASQMDQFVVTLNYEQSVTQIAAKDFPVSHQEGVVPLAIHHEPGLWLHMKNETIKDLDIARLATVPHGDSVLALGTSADLDSMPIIPRLNGLPIGAGQDLDNSYLEPYKHFVDNPFRGTVDDSNFPGFNPLDLNALLNLANNGVNIGKTTRLEVDTTFGTGGVLNIPFVTRKADASSMKSTFWIQELANNELRLQYSQVVDLEFFGITWPHVSINTLVKVS